MRPNRGAFRRDATAFERAAHVVQPLQQEGAVPRVGLGEIGREAEASQHGLLQIVGAADRVLQGVVVFGATRSLHPVEHEAASANRALVEHPNARLVNYACAPTGSSRSVARTIPSSIPSKMMLWNGKSKYQ